VWSFCLLSVRCRFFANLDLSMFRRKHSLAFTGGAECEHASTRTILGIIIPPPYVYNILIEEPADRHPVGIRAGKAGPSDSSKVRAPCHELRAHVTWQMDGSCSEREQAFSQAASSVMIHTKFLRLRAACGEMLPEVGLDTLCSPPELGGQIDAEDWLDALGSLPELGQIVVEEFIVVLRFRNGKACRILFGNRHSAFTFHTSAQKVWAIYNSSRSPSAIPSGRATASCSQDPAAVPVPSPRRQDEFLSFCGDHLDLAAANLLRASPVRIRCQPAVSESRATRSGRSDALPVRCRLARRKVSARHQKPRTSKQRLAAKRLLLGRHRWGGKARA